MYGVLPGLATLKQHALLPKNGFDNRTNSNKLSRTGGPGGNLPVNAAANGRPGQRRRPTSHRLARCIARMHPGWDPSELFVAVLALCSSVVAACERGSWYTSRLRSASTAARKG
jgi:hypothetical protein